MNLKKILLGTALGLAVAGCSPSNGESLYGEFHGNEVVVQKSGTNQNSRIIIRHEHNLDLNSSSLVGLDVDGNGIYEEITLQGIRVGKLKQLSPYMSKRPLAVYANSDSLKAAYNKVLKQNGRRK